MAYKRKAYKGKGKRSKVSVAQIVTDRILEDMAKGEVTWHKPWKAIGGASRSYAGHPYRGLNILLTAVSGLAGPWITYDKAMSLGGHVKKDEKGTLIVLWKLFNKEKANKDGTKEKTSFAMMRYYKVFSLCQCENVPKPSWLVKAEAKLDKNEHTPIEQADLIWEGYKGKPKMIDGGDRAYYAPLTDQIGMPSPESFDSPEAYYSTLFHEGTHSTGSKGRLDRLGNTALAPFGSEDYSKEELVAEIGASILSAHAGIACAKVQKNTTAYLQNWMKRLKDDPSLIVQASGQAQKAVDHILGTEFKKTSESISD